MSDLIRNVTDDSFDTDVIAASQTKPVLVDFWAAWCGPCRMMAPVLDKLAQTRGDNLIVAKVNIDENPHKAGQLGVRSIPTLFLFHHGKQVASTSGALSDSALASWLSQNGV